MQKFFATGDPRAATATYDGIQSGALRLTVVSVSASGTGTVTGRPAGSPGFETIYDTDGTTPLTFDLSESQASRVLDCDYEAVKVQSDTAEDEFYLMIAAVDRRR